MQSALDTLLSPYLWAGSAEVPGGLCFGQASPSPPVLLCKQEQGQELNPKGRLGTCKKFPPVDITCLPWDAKMLHSKNSACSQLTGCPCPQSCRVLEMGGKQCCHQHRQGAKDAKGAALGVRACWLPALHNSERCPNKAEGTVSTY